MRTNPYVSGAVITGCAFILCPPAGIVLGIMLLCCWVEDLSTRTVPEPKCWQHEDETGLETLYACECHRMMGNDFYFLPHGQCLNGRCNSPGGNNPHK